MGISGLTPSVIQGIVSSPDQGSINISGLDPSIINGFVGTSGQGEIDIIGYSGEYTNPRIILTSTPYVSVDYSRIEIIVTRS